MPHTLNDWEPVIGLEIHVELNTRSKLFSSAPNHFGDEPNTNITDVCTGMPGTLPVLNAEVVRKAVQFGLAVGAEISHFSRFDRKSYFYPDSPRNFQITQFAHPIVHGGTVVAEVDGEEKIFPLDRAHIEDDAGMLKHFSTFAGVDYNRAGVPLIEIVSEPCLHSGKDASAYAMAIKAILQYLDVSDCNMEEGSLRFDANISVRKKGEKGLRPKTEIKNMNSFYNMELAIEAETARQIRLYTQHPDEDPKKLMPQATYRWDPEKKLPVLMRRKESADDYRYFPEPDLPPIQLNAAYIEQVRSTLPELPLQRKRRYIADFGLSHHSAFLITADKELASYFEEGLKNTSNARSLCNWITVEFAGRLAPLGKTVLKSGIPAAQIASLVNCIDAGTITGKIAKSVADEMTLHPEKTCEQVIQENPNFQPIHDTQEIEKLIDEVLSQHGQSVSDYRAGNKRAFGFLMGQVMALSQGTAAPKAAHAILTKKLES